MCEKDPIAADCCTKLDAWHAVWYQTCSVKCWMREARANDLQRCLILILLCAADDVKKGFDVHFSDTFEDVYKVALDYDVNTL